MSNDTYYYTTTTTPTPMTSTSLNPAYFLTSFITFAVFYVIYSLLLGQIFHKAGVARWKAWVPVYSLWVLMKLGNQHPVWAILMFIPIINIVAAIFMYIAMYHIGRKLGKPGAFVLLAIFLPIVWYVWLAFDHSTWHEDRERLPSQTPVYPPSTPTTPPTTTISDNPSTPEDSINSVTPSVEVEPSTSSNPTDPTLPRE